MYRWVEKQFRAGWKPIMYDLDEEVVGVQQNRQAECESRKSEWELASGKTASNPMFKLFIRIGAVCKQIRKRPREVSSPKLYESKTEKLLWTESWVSGGYIRHHYLCR